jgi:hypothetical protein
MPTPLAARFDAYDPGLDNDVRTLADLYDEMPKGPASSVPLAVKLFENPSSPWALPGAVDLFGHDCIHLVLGRGLLPQDEAFIVGFTMGASGRCRPAHARLLALWARSAYPSPFRFSKLDAQVFRFAVEAAQNVGCKPLHEASFRAVLQEPLGRIRALLGVRPERLRSIYAREAALFPATRASARLRKRAEEVSGQSRPPISRAAPWDVSLNCRPFGARAQCP